MRRPLIGSLLIAIPLLGILTFSLGGCGAIKRFMYSGFDREEWQHPEQVVAALELSLGDQVADLGAGGGYFTFRLAEAVGENGKVYAIDVDPDMLEYIDVSAAQQGLTQIFTVMGEASDPGLPGDSVDLIFISNTFHHLPERVDYFRGARSALKAGGRIAVVELSESSFPAGHYTEPSLIVSEMHDAGYRLVVSHDFLSRQSFQIFTPVSEPGDDAPASDVESAE